MATVVDSNVIIDVVEPNSPWRAWSSAALLDAQADGNLIFNVVIAAEVAHEVSSADRFHAVFNPAVWIFEDIPADAGLQAGWAHRLYRARGGARERTLPDLLIGAHASIRGHRLITRDPKRYRAYFPAIAVVAPDTHP